MPHILPLLWLVPALPLLGAAILFLFGRSIEPARSNPSRVPGIVCTVLAAVSFLVLAGCVLELQDVANRTFELRGGPWFDFDGWRADWGLLLDPLSAVLSILVSGIGLLVLIYSRSYMEHDRDQYRYYGALSFFIAVMQLLVLANNYLLLFAAWEGVGLASYLLIGFHFERQRAGIAALKAFVINRIGDAGLMLGVFMIFAEADTFRFGDVRLQAASWDASTISIIAALLFLGAIGKSAQLPLHIWLPDAMEGPTPVSALIHSATMVCAGVYLISRSSFLFVAAPQVSFLVAALGTVTALIAATIALVENDLKRILAFSTVSQIGFMFVALGARAYDAALFHLFTHAFFKSLLFLGAGSVIHALHGEQNVKHMGGLRKAMPITFVTMWIAAAALSGIPGFAGFFSKDAILGATLGASGGGWLFAVGIANSLLTACYAWRMMMLVFYGRPGSDYEGVHEAPLSMRLPLVVLSLGAIVSGWFFLPIRWEEWPLLTVSALIAFAGLLLARYFYLQNPAARTTLDRRLAWLTQVLRNRYYIDALYEERILNGLVLKSAEGAVRIDSLLIDGAVRGTSWLTGRMSAIMSWIDRSIIDGVVRLCSATARYASAPARAVQTGIVQTYAFIFVAGLLAALSFYLVR